MAISGFFIGPHPLAIRATTHSNLAGCETLSLVLLHVFAPRVHHVHGASTSLFVLCLCTHGRLNTLDLKGAAAAWVKAPDLPDLHQEQFSLAFRLAAHATPGAFHPEQLCLHPLWPPLVELVSF